MKIVNVQQGSQSWHEHRASHCNASDAPAMLGLSKYKSRDALLREKATGITEDVDSATQRRFDDGHYFEALARPMAEEYIGQELYPVTGADGIYSASFDGITEDHSVIFEHKTLNDDIRPCKTAADLDVMYRIQMEQQLMVSGAEKCLFVASKWDEQDVCLESLHLWYEPDLALRAQIVAGWEQFSKDWSNYQHVAPAVEVVGRAPETLPALFIEVTGMVTASNLEDFKQASLAVFGSINKDLQTDEDFANAEKAVKWCKDVEERLDGAKQHALSQTASIDELFRALDSIKEEARATRLELDKLVKSRKESVRVEILQGAQKALADYVAGLNQAIGKPYMPQVAADFAGAMKGKKTVASLRSACNDELARAKISANEISNRIQINMGSLRELAVDYVALFPDTAQIVLKANDDLVALIKSRISDHKEAEQLRAEALAESERQKIREEEEAKARAKVAEERAVPTAGASPEISVTAPVVERQPVIMDAEDVRRGPELAQRNELMSEIVEMLHEMSVAKLEKIKVLVAEMESR